jgi:hypothetical protein
MLFLTTNRLEDFDDAFYNRVNITVKYQSLQPPERESIWRQHVTRSLRKGRNGGEDNDAAVAREVWPEEAFSTLGRIPTNGRDIRNYTRTAFAFARALREHVSIKHILSVIRNNLDVDVLSSLQEIFEELERIEASISSGRENPPAAKDALAGPSTGPPS